MNFKKIFFPVLLCFGIITALQAGDFSNFYRTGLRKLNSRDYDGALIEFKKAFNKAELSKEEIRVLLIISDVYYRQKKYKDAKNWALRILDLPDLKLKDKINAYRRLINYSIKLKRYDDALDDVRTALRLVSDNKDKATLFLDRARIFEAEKKYTEALEALRDCAKISESISKQWQVAQQRVIVILYRQKKDQEILKLLPDLQVDEWNTSSKQIVCYYAGLSAMRMENYKIAINWFERMSDKGHAWLVYSKNNKLGNSWKKLREYEKAYKCFEAITKNDKLQNYYQGNALYLMAEVRYLQKKYKDSKLLCEELKKSPKVSKRQIKRANRLLGRMKK